MDIPREFDEIRPFQPEELPEVYDRLLANEQFQAVLSYLYPAVPLEKIGARMRACRTSLDFQKAFCYDFIGNLMARVSDGCDMDSSAIDTSGRYTFVSNHRDIVLDSAILDKLLIDAGFTTTCEIAIGDNLLSLPWVKDLVRLNKSFIVERDLPIRQMLMASKRLSEYMHFAIREKHENIWIAQREGRAKDSDDRTQEAVLKMMAMGGEGSAVERLMQLHVVPLAISYEFDPCDFLKAREYQLRRDNPDWKKSAADDVVSMKTGIMGYKGRVHYQCAPCIDGYLQTLLTVESPKNDFYTSLAAYIDRQIFKGYRLYPCNYVAWDLLDGQDHSSHYSDADVRRFEDYLQAQISKIDLPSPDVPFLRERLLTMYANPARNYSCSAG